VWTRGVDHRIAEPMAKGFRYTDGPTIFEDSIHCIPAGRADLKAFAQQGMTWLDGLIAGRSFICGEQLALADIRLFVFMDCYAWVRQPLNEANKNIAGWYSSRMKAPPSAIARSISSGGQTVIPCGLRRGGCMRVSRAGIGDDKQPRSADAQRLFAQFRLPQCRSMRANKGPKAHHPMEACDIRLKHFKFYHQIMCRRGELPGVEFIRAGSGPLHDIGEADPMIQQHRVVRRFQQIHPEGAARRFTKNGPRKCRPEPIRLSREIMPLFCRIDRRVDPDEHQIEAWAQQIRQGHGHILCRERRHGQVGPPPAFMPARTDP
jgi:hypothetical protein